ncbi:unnamed protein product, partial [Effrenium voratum]
ACGSSNVAAGLGQPLMPTLVNLGLIDEELPSCSSSRDDEDWDSLDTAEGPSQERENSPSCADSPQDVDAEFSERNALSREPSPARLVSRPSTPFKSSDCVGWGVSFRRPTPPMVPKEPDLGPPCEAQARIRRIVPREVKDPDIMDQTAPCLPRQDSKGILGEADVQLPGSIMDPILEDGGIVPGGRSRPAKRSTRCCAWIVGSPSGGLRDLDEGPSPSSGPRYAGTPAQAAEALLSSAELVNSRASSRNSSPAERVTVSKVAMPRHVACIRKQVLASRRLEELDLPRGKSPRRQLSTV